MPGPPKQFDRDEALTRAMEVFWANGYDGTNYEMLVSSMGVSRSSLYATFGGKEALFRAALESYARRQLVAMTAALRGEGTPLERLARGLKQYLETVAQDDGLGCLIVNATCEFGTNSPVNDLLDQVRDRIEGLFVDLLDRALEAGELPGSADTGALARFTRTFVYGIGVAVRAGQNTPDLAGEIDHLIQMMQIAGIAR
jgi:AcrR family transcriptional regulator